MFFIISAGKTWECKQGYRKWEARGKKNNLSLPSSPQIRSKKNREKAKNNKASAHPSVSAAFTHREDARMRALRAPHARATGDLWSRERPLSHCLRQASDALWVVPRAAPSRLIGQIHHASASQVTPSSLLCLLKQRGVKERFHRGKHCAIRGRTRCRC